MPGGGGVKWEDRPGSSHPWKSRICHRCGGPPPVYSFKALDYHRNLFLGGPPEGLLAMPRPLSVKIAIAVAFLVAGFVVLFGVGLKGSLVYYLTVGEFLDRSGHEDLGENYRINGNVVPGSIRKDPRVP